MAINPANGVLDITNGIIRVSAIDVRDATGFNTAINNVARNTILLYDDQESTTNFIPHSTNDYQSTTGVTRDTTNKYIELNSASDDGWIYWPLKLPNAWKAEFDMNITASGGLFTFTFFNTSTPNHSNDLSNDGGYKIIFDNTNNNIIFRLQGVSKSTTSVNLRSNDWQHVNINYYYGQTSVSIDGKIVASYRFTEDQHETNHRYVGFSAKTGTIHKIRKININNADKWTFTDDSNASDICYLNGNVGIGTTTTDHLLDVHGNAYISENLTIQGDLNVLGTTTMVQIEDLQVENAIIELGNNNVSDTIDLGIVMNRPTANVVVGFRGDESELAIGYTHSDPSGSHIVPIADGALKTTIYGNLHSNNVTTGGLTVDDGFSMGSHILPTSNDTYDIGSAEYKIRDLYVADNSLWVGDEAKITFSSGELKFRKRKTDTVPAAVTAAGGHATGAKAFAGVSNLTDIKAYHWLKYMRTLSGQSNAKMSDVFRDDDADYETTSTSSAWSDVGDHMHTVQSVAIGKTTAPTAPLDVAGAGVFSGNITTTGNIGVNKTSPTADVHVVGYQYINDAPTITNSFDHTTAPLTLTNSTVTSTTAVNDPSPVLHLTREGTSSQSYGARATMDLCRWENNGTNSRSRLDFQLAEGTYANTHVMSLRSDGRVGIGVTSPAYKLDVDGDINLSTGSTLRINGTPAVFSNWTVSGSNIYRPSGNVGIGTTSPQEKFHLYGSPIIQHETRYSVGANDGWYKIGTWDAASADGARLKISLLGAESYSALESARGGETIIYASINNNNPTSVSNMSGSIHAHGKPVITQAKFKQVGTDRTQYEIIAYVEPYTQHTMKIECSETTTFTRAWMSASDPGADSATVQAALFTHVVDNAGNVGIGTATVDGPLHIFKTAATDSDIGGGIKFERWDNYGCAIWSQYHGSIECMNFRTAQNATDAYGGTPQMVLTHQGRVGIGTSNPVDALDVVADDAWGGIKLKTSTNNVIKMGRNATSDGGFIEMHNNGVFTTWICAYGDSHFNGGNVGIGTTGPGAHLHVYKNGYTPRVLIETPGAHDAELKLKNSNGNWVFRCLDSSGDLRFNGTSGFKLVLTQGGNVGIGVTSPDEMLDVDGNVKIRGANTYLSWNNDQRLIMEYDNHYRQGIHFDANARLMRLFSTTNDSGGGIVFQTRAASGSSGTDYGSERMRITSNGNVGINDSSPSYKLSVNGSFRVHGNTSTFGSDGLVHINSRSTQYGSETVALQTTIDGRALTDANPGHHGSEQRNVLSFQPDGGYVGIGTTGPTSKLHLRHGSGDNVTTFKVSSGGTVRIERNHNNGPWIQTTMSSGMAGIHFGNSDNWLIRKWYSNLDFDYNGSTKGYLLGSANVGQIDFTGQHRSFIDDVLHTEYDSHEGLIVSANKNKYFDIDEDLTTGANAIQISQSIPLVSISTKEKDKACFGVISGSEDPDSREYAQGSFVTVVQKQVGDRRAFINSIGEGAIWVTNINGNLESGDYITTSNVAGYGMRQDSEFLANYTVAKITMDCDFEPVTQPIQTIKKELGNVNYWVETTYSNVTLEEYSNLTEENRQTVTTTVYSNEEGNITVAQYSNLESNVQATYSEIETVTYQKIERKESKTEQEGYTLEVREKLVNVLDEHGQLQWEDHPTDTEKAYKIRYLTSDGTRTDEANAVHIAAFVGCTYHCG